MLRESHCWYLLQNQVVVIKVSLVQMDNLVTLVRRGVPVALESLENVVKRETQVCMISKLAVPRPLKLIYCCYRY